MWVLTTPLSYVFNIGLSVSKGDTAGTVHAWGRPRPAETRPGADARSAGL